MNCLGNLMFAFAAVFAIVSVVAGTPIPASTPTGPDYYVLFRKLFCKAHNALEWNNYLYQTFKQDRLPSVDMDSVSHVQVEKLVETSEFEPYERFVTYSEEELLAEHLRYYRQYFHVMNLIKLEEQKTSFSKIFLNEMSQVQIRIGQTIGEIVDVMTEKGYSVPDDLSVDQKVTFPNEDEEYQRNLRITYLLHTEQSKHFTKGMDDFGRLQFQYPPTTESACVEPKPPTITN